MSGEAAIGWIREVVLYGPDPWASATHSAWSSAWACPAIRLIHAAV